MCWEAVAAWFPFSSVEIARGGPISHYPPGYQAVFYDHPGSSLSCVLQAAGMSAGGETFVLNMGQQVKILSLAEDLIRLSGLEPGKDIEIVLKTRLE